MNGIDYEYFKPIPLSECKCYRCGGVEGIACIHKGNEFLAWFCKNNECIQISCEIGKKKEHINWSERMEELRKDAAMILSMNQKDKSKSSK